MSCLQIATKDNPLMIGEAYTRMLKKCLLKCARINVVLACAHSGNRISTGVSEAMSSGHDVFRCTFQECLRNFN